MIESNAQTNGDGVDADRQETAAASPETIEQPLLSVVVVTYNEADRIADCLDAVFAACRAVPRFEVILVDSNSDDETVEIAQGYDDVTILEISEESLTTPGAGRYVGTERAQGEYVLYVDGDITLTDSGWVGGAVDALADDPSLAGVDGYLDECLQEDATAVEYLHGVAMYDREALAEVGGYHPFLEAWEDVDLGFELTLAGYELRRLPVVTGVHGDRSSPLDQLRRWRRGYYEAGGQVCAKAATRPALLAKWLRFFADKAMATAWLIVGAALAATRPRALLGWIGASVAGGTALAVRMGPANAAERLLSFVLFPVGFVLGLRPVPPRSAFPDDAVRTVSEPTEERRAAPADD